MGSHGGGLAKFQLTGEDFEINFPKVTFIFPRGGIYPPYNRGKLSLWKLCPIIVGYGQVTPESGRR